MENRKNELIDLSKKIHSHPELGWKENKASNWLAEYLEKYCFQVEKGIYDLPTAFKASYGKGSPVVCFTAEYDALPDIGHGCGHNIIGSAAAGAAVASRIIADECTSEIVVIGCPAEEKLGGKVPLVNKGAFHGIDAALQIHPVAKNENWAGFTGTACVPIDVEYFGKETHAGVSPWVGASALQALIEAFNNINGMRLHIKDGARIAGIITDGGKAANVIPKHAAGSDYGMESMILAAKALAMTAADVITQPETLKKMKQEFDKI